MMYFLPHLYNRQRYEIVLNTIETGEFYPSVTVDVSHNSSEFEALGQKFVN